MTNRVTDQATQNALIDKFKLEGLLAELSINPVIVPVVTVAAVGDALTVSNFEKWRSVFTKSPVIVDPSNVTPFANPFVLNTYNIADSPEVISSLATSALGGGTGVRLPSAAVGVPAGDGLYRISLISTCIPAANISGQVDLRDQAAFGAAVAIGTLRAKIGDFTTSDGNGPSQLVFDQLVKIRGSLVANAVVFHAALGAAGTMSITLVVTKLIGEIPPAVPFS